MYRQTDGHTTTACRVSIASRGKKNVFMSLTCLTRVSDKVWSGQGQKWAGTRRYGVPADAISVPADSAAAVVKFTISIPRESCTNAKAKYIVVV